jgi:hypothetical protein
MTTDDELLIRYLLGKTTPEEADRLFERQMSDPAYLEHAMVVEEELIDLYVVGRLPRSDRRALERKIDTSPSLRQKVQLASSIYRHVVQKPISRMRPSARKVWAFRLVVATCILIVLLSALWLGHKRNVNIPVQTENAPSRPAVAPTPEGSKEQLPKISPESSSATVIATLMPIERAQSTTKKRISVSNDAKWVRLRLVLQPADEFQFYRAHIGLEGNESKIVSGWTPARKAPEGRVVVLKIAADRLFPGQYLVLLEGKADGTIENAEGYVFTVE